MQPDPADQPEQPGWGLVLPFTVVASRGGPYDDSAFVAGFQVGQIFQALATAAGVGASRVWFGQVHAALAPQLDLVAMHHGYTAAVEVSGQWPDWCTATFTRAEPPELAGVGEPDG